VAHTNPNSHLPYAIRYMARLQEQAARAGATHGVPSERLQKCAAHLQVTARSIEQGSRPPGQPAPEPATQKMKLLNFLRQQQ